MKKAIITGVQGWVPETRLTNKDLEKMVDTNDEWIRTRTGIEERRILKKEGWANSDMIVEAMKGLMTKTGLKPEEIDLMIVGTVTEDYRFPDTANVVLNKIGAKNAFGYDIHAACSGFLYALSTGASFIESGKYKKVVVVGADMMSSIIDYEDRATCIIFGDGAGAVLLEPSEDDIVGIQDAILKADGAGGEFLHMKGGGSKNGTSHQTVDQKMHYVYQEGRSVFKSAIQGMSDTITQVMKRNHLTHDDVDWLIPHQANMRIIQSVASAVDFPMEKVVVNIQKYGNTTAGTIPLCMWEWESKFKKGDTILLTAFGGGFTWGTIYLKWAYDSADNS
jgi:3-oxoacyl-[acyl-carrier-protein] synthase-3